MSTCPQSSNQSSPLLPQNRLTPLQSSNQPVSSLSQKRLIPPPSSNQPVRVLLPSPSAPPVSKRPVGTSSLPVGAGNNVNHTGAKPVQGLPSRRSAPIRRNSSLALKNILSRANDSSRRLDPSHVVGLAESIAVNGLIEPLVVDNKNRLVAGGHRLAALQLLALSCPKRIKLWESLFLDNVSCKVFDRLMVLRPLAKKIPVRVLDFDSATKPQEAKQVEITENEKRRGYKSEEILALAKELRDQGCHYTVGAPRKGKVALAPMLATRFGMSLRMIRRILKQEHAPEMVTDVTIDNAVKEDERLKAALSSWLRVRGIDGAPTVTSLVDKLLHALGDAMQER